MTSPSQPGFAPTPPDEVVLARHGETEWSRTGQHTGRTDIPLTDQGEADARTLRTRLAGLDFSRVLTSPLQRAARTCELAGFGDRAEAWDDLMEWDYGDHEGLTSDQIREQHPGWDVFRHGCPNGESVEQLTARADRVVRQLADIPGRVLVFGHGHFSRALGLRWIGLELSWGRNLALSTAAVCTLGYEDSRDCPALLLWNDHRHVRAPRGQFPPPRLG
jgi:probable phosphoglycerate mutase